VARRGCRSGGHKHYWCRRRRCRRCTLGTRVMAGQLLSQGVKLGTYRLGELVQRAAEAIRRRQLASSGTDGRLAGRHAGLHGLLRSLTLRGARVAAAGTAASNGSAANATLRSELQLTSPLAGETLRRGAASALLAARFGRLRRNRDRRTGWRRLLGSRGHRLRRRQRLRLWLRLGLGLLHRGRDASTSRKLASNAQRLLSGLLRDGYRATGGLAGSLLRAAD